MKYFVRIVIGISMIILGHTLRWYYGEGIGSILPMVIAAGMVLAGYYIGHTLASIVLNYQKVRRLRRCLSLVHTVKDGDSIQKPERSHGESTWGKRHQVPRQRQWLITPEGESVSDNSKSVEKRLAIQTESDYDRGFRQGRANSEANMAANLAANERLRLINRTLEGKLANIQQILNVKSY